MTGVDCPRCGSDVPAVSNFCHRCGAERRAPVPGRPTAYAARPDEPVASLRLVSTIMPQGAGQQPSTYKLALGIALLLTVVTAALGALPVAIMVAAFAVPIVYIVYLYDVNLWEDEPVPVVVAAFVLTGALAAVLTWFWADRLVLSTDTIGANPAGPSGRDLLLLLLLVPVLSELVRQVGPLYLASRPRYDDLMDGFTFGVVAGVGFACFETLVLHWGWVSGGFAGPGTGAGTWISVVVLHGFVKPLIYGSATGLAVAEFSGLGERYDGFTARWVSAMLRAIAVNALFQGGVYLLAFVGGHGSTIGAVLGVVWGLVLLAGLIVMVRTVLHKGLLEAALESAARGGSRHASRPRAVCPRCEMPLLTGSEFCSACGNSVRSVPKSARGAAERRDGAAGGDVTIGETQG